MLLYAKRGALAAVATFLMTFIASLAAVNYYTLVEELLVWIYGPLREYADAIGLLFVFVVVLGLLQYLAVTFLEESIQINSVVNGVTGAVFGGLAGMLLAGLLAIAWLMLPGSMYFLGEPAGPNQGAKVLFSADEQFLKMARFMSNERINGSEPLDPTNSFMKDKTNKFRGQEGGQAASGTGQG